MEYDCVAKIKASMKHGYGYNVEEYKNFCKNPIDKSYFCNCGGGCTLPYEYEEQINERTKKREKRLRFLKKQMENI